MLEFNRVDVTIYNKYLRLKNKNILKEKVFVFKEEKAELVMEVLQGEGYFTNSEQGYEWNASYGELGFIFSSGWENKWITNLFGFYDRHRIDDRSKYIPRTREDLRGALLEHDERILHQPLQDMELLHLQTHTIIIQSTFIFHHSSDEEAEHLNQWK